jgi:hypothetical protein
MTNPQIERILISLQRTLKSTNIDPQTRQAVALRQVNKALADIEPPYVLCVGKVDPGSREIVIKTRRKQNV